MTDVIGGFTRADSAHLDEIAKAMYRSPLRVEPALWEALADDRARYPNLGKREDAAPPFCRHCGRGFRKRSDDGRVTGVRHQGRGLCNNCHKDYRHLYPIRRVRHTHCLGCGVGLVQRGQRVPEGCRTHEARGLCRVCYRTERGEIGRRNGSAARESGE